VEPRGLEPLASAMRGRLDSFLQISVACKIAANRGIYFMMLFLTFQDIYSGCCTVAAQRLRLLHTHKIWDDRYSTNSLEAIYLSFVVGAFYKVPGLRGPGFHKRATMPPMFAHSYQG
jgi:hypothetical protein